MNDPLGTEPIYPNRKETILPTMRVIGSTR